MRSRRNARLFVLAIVLATSLASCRTESRRRDAPVVDLLATPPTGVALETRRYRFGTDDRSALLSGWSSRNERDRHRRSFVWATAEESRFRLDVLRVEDKQALVTLRAFPSAEPQRIAVFVNDRMLADLRPEIDDREFRFEIPADVLRLGENVLSFRHTFVTPGPNPRDPRRFAAAYGSLLVGPACLPLRALGEPEPPSVERGAEAPHATVVGPAAMSWTVDVPRGATLVAKVAVPRESVGAAEVVVQARTPDRDWSSLRETVVSRPWLRRQAKARIAVDLSALASRRADLRVIVRPLACETALATVRLKRLAITLQSVDGA